MSRQARTALTSIPARLPATMVPDPGTGVCRSCESPRGSFHLDFLSHTDALRPVIVTLALRCTGPTVAHRSSFLQRKRHPEGHQECEAVAAGEQP
jgi:hypothetical protein